MRSTTIFVFELIKNPRNSFNTVYERISEKMFLNYMEGVLNIKTEQHNIAILHHVVLALHAYQPFFSGCIVGTAV